MGLDEAREGFPERAHNGTAGFKLSQRNITARFTALATDNLDPTKLGMLRTILAKVLGHLAGINRP